MQIGRATRLLHDVGVFRLSNLGLTGDTYELSFWITHRGQPSVYLHVSGMGVFSVECICYLFCYFGEGRLCIGDI